MTQKRMFKVLAAIPKHDGTGEWLMRCGSAYENRDSSMNVYLDAIPVGVKIMKLQIRELDARDLAQREARSAARSTARTLDLPTPGGSANESTTF